MSMNLFVVVFFLGCEVFVKFYKEMKNIYWKNGFYMIVEGVKFVCF